MPSRPESTRTDPEALIAALAEDARRRAAEGAETGAAHDAEAGAAHGPEPDPEQILDYLEGRLPPAEAAKLERRLVADPAAARALADLAELSAAGTAEPSAAADLAVHAGWRDFEKRLARERRRRGGRAPWLPSIAAAALAAAGLGYWAGTARQAFDRAIPIAARLDLRTVRSAGTAPDEAVVAEGAWIQLSMEVDERCDRYRAVIDGPGAAGETVEDLRWISPGQVEVSWSGEPGDHRLTLYCEPGRRLQEHGFRVVRPPPGSGEGGGG